MNLKRARKLIEKFNIDRFPVRYVNDTKGLQVFIDMAEFDITLPYERIEKLINSTKQTHFHHIKAAIIFNGGRWRMRHPEGYMQYNIQGLSYLLKRTPTQAILKKLNGHFLSYGTMGGMRIWETECDNIRKVVITSVINFKLDKE
jgi:hypothetical protein